MENFMMRSVHGMNKNDERIIQLKNQIKEKKKQLDDSLRFTPITNCSIELDEVRYNIHTLSREQLVLLLVKLYSYLHTAEFLGVADELIISGYNINNWLEDVDNKIKVVDVKTKEKDLKAMESKLNKLLSDQKKTELEIDELESLLE